MKSNRPWRAVVAALLLVTVLAATPAAAAPASAGQHHGTSWIGWLVAQVGYAWHQLVAGVHTDDNQPPDPKPGP